MNKKGMEMAEIFKIIVAVLILVIMAAAIGILIAGKGGDALQLIKNMLRFGR